jgi:hypothetical protein
MHQLRGARVKSMSPEEIHRTALAACLILGFSSQYEYRKRPKRFDAAFEKLFERGITIDPIDDDEWFDNTFDVTIGHCDPDSLTIRIPNRIYERACYGEQNALMIVFHELGHLLLQHKALLHFSNQQASLLEDSEWQADHFAEVILEQLGYETKQLAFEFN